MKKTFLISIICTLLMLTACSSNDEKVNVIKGPGAANDSQMVSFNELCEGTAAGFLGNSENLLVTRKDSREYKLFSVNTVSKESSFVCSVSSDNEDYLFEIAPDGKKLIFNNRLVDIESKQSSFLPNAGIPPGYKPDGFPTLQSYSFTKDSEVILSSPFHYIKKYYALSRTSFDNGTVPETRHILFMEVGERIKEPTPNMFSGIKVPDITSLKDPKLLLDELKYVFIGFSKDAGQTPLYVFDFFKKSFVLIDENVRTYDLSPDRKKAAYVKKSEKSGFPDTLLTFDLETGEKKELKSSSLISGIKWSQSSSWIAYSAGENTECDIGIVKADGSANEQLTYGMHSGEMLAWSRSGSKLAFTSRGQKTSEAPKVYIITLNIKETYDITGNTDNDPARRQMLRQLSDIIKKETSTVFKQGGKG